MAKKKINAEYMTDTFMSAINVDALIKALEDGKLSPSLKAWLLSDDETDGCAEKNK